MDLREILWEVVDWLHLAQDRDQWRAVVNTVMKLRLHKRLLKNYSAPWDLFSYEGPQVARCKEARVVSLFPSPVSIPPVGHRCLNMSQFLNSRLPLIL
jgi:hypothetical protein